MRILLTNDDGIHAEGLGALERIARALSDDVWIVAPETDQSGLAHSLSLSEPLRLRKISDKHYALRGTPFRPENVTTPGVPEAGLMRARSNEF